MMTQKRAKSPQVSCEDNEREKKLLKHSRDEDLLLRALHRHAQSHELPTGRPKNIPAAQTLYEALVQEAAHVPSMYNLAILLETAPSPINRDVIRATRLYERAVAQGHVPAMIRLAILLCRRIGPPQMSHVQANIDRAVKLFEAAIPADCTGLAAYHYATLLETGRGNIKPHPAKAAALYHRAYKRGGHLDAAVGLAALYLRGAPAVKKDVNQAIWLYERGVTAGHAAAICGLAAVYRTGAPGIPSDPLRAVKLLETAVAKGSSAAITQLASMFEAGEGIRRDLPRAAALFGRAADAGSVDAMVRLAILLQEGRHGVPYDPKRAAALYERAVAVGADTVASTNLALLLRTGAMGVPKNVVRAVYLLQQVVDRQCFPSDLTILARLLASELSAPARDMPRAKALLDSAIKGYSHAPAIHELARLLQFGAPGLPANVERANGLHALCKKRGRYDRDNYEYTQFHRRCVDMGSDCDVLLERTLRRAKVDSRQTSMLVLGGAGRGKLSVLRKMEPMLLAPPCAVFNQGWITPGFLNIGQQAIGELYFRSESLVGHLSRVDDVPTDAMERDAVSEQPSTQGIRPELITVDDAVMEEESDPALPETPAPVEAPAEKPRKEPQSNNVKVVSSDTNKMADHCPNSDNVVEVVDLESPEKEPEKETEKETEKEIEKETEKDSVITVEETWLREMMERVRIGLSEYPFPEDRHTVIVRCIHLAVKPELLRTNSLFAISPRVVVFFVDLDHICIEETAMDEARELCHWMQVAFAASSNAEEIHPIIVGTRRNKTGRVHETWAILEKLLAQFLGDAAYDMWVRIDANNESRVKFSIINLSTLEQNISTSGFVELDRLLKTAAEKVVASRANVPARWFAIMEYFELLKHSSALFVGKKTMIGLMKQFPGFEKDERVLEWEAIRALRFLSGLGRIVLVEFSKEEYYVFMEPSKILSAVCYVTNPDPTVFRRLDRRSVMLLGKGMVNASALTVLWHEYCEEFHATLIEILCRYDVLMKLGTGDTGKGEREDLFGIPPLLASKASEINCTAKQNQVQLRIMSRFSDSLNPGLQGSLMACLQPRVAGGEGEPSLLRPEIAMLSLSGARRIAIGFSHAGRCITWTIIANDAIALAHECMLVLEELVEKVVMGKTPGPRHYIIGDCHRVQESCPAGCNVEFEIPKRWVKSGNEEGKIEDISGTCASEVLWVMSRVIPNISYG